jgi:hypothetical protein
MAIKLFDIQGGKVVPTEHCHIIPFLKRIMDEYPDNYLSIYAYLFYMSCRSSENPYFNRPQEELQEEILKDLEAQFDPEDRLIRMALDKCKSMYETPTVRAYNGIVNMLEKLAFYMETQTITDGRDGNITAIISAAKNFDSIRKSFKGVAKDLEEEQSSRARGGQKLSYDD